MEPQRIVQSKKVMQIEHSLQAVAAPVTSFRQSFDGASTHFVVSTMNQSFSWAVEVSFTSFRRSLNAVSIKKTMQINHFLELLRLPLQAFGRASTEPQRVFNWKSNENQAFSWAVEAPVTSCGQSLNGASTHSQLKKQAQTMFFQSLRPLVTLAF